MTVPFGYSEREDSERRCLRVNAGTIARSGCSLKTRVSIFIAATSGERRRPPRWTPGSLVKLAAVVTLHLNREQDQCPCQIRLRIWKDLKIQTVPSAFDSARTPKFPLVCKSRLMMAGRLATASFWALANTIAFITIKMSSPAGKITSTGSRAFGAAPSSTSSSCAAFAGNSSVSTSEGV